MSSQLRHRLLEKERRVNLAIQSLKLGQFQSQRSAARALNACPKTLERRLDGVPSRLDCTANSRILSNLEEEVIVEYILDLDSRGFAPNLSHVREMANSI